MLGDAATARTARALRATRVTLIANFFGVNKIREVTVCASVCVWNVHSVCVMRLVCRPGVSMKILKLPLSRVTRGGWRPELPRSVVSVDEVADESRVLNTSIEQRGSKYARV